jgi:hypothetical protein
MADFTPNTTTKSAIRNLAVQLADVTAFDNIVAGVIANNPFQCVSYNAAGVNHPPVERGRETYTARVIYQDTNAKTIGLITIQANTIAGYTAVANNIVANAGIATAMGGTPARDLENEKFVANLKCHDANGEIYYVDFSRNRVRLSSYTDDAIQSRVETWADTVPELN